MPRRARRFEVWSHDGHLVAAYGDAATAQRLRAQAALGGEELRVIDTRHPLRAFARKFTWSTALGAAWRGKWAQALLAVLAIFLLERFRGEP